MEDRGQQKTRRESRREQRKESRLLKRKNRLLSWVQRKSNGKREDSKLESPDREFHDDAEEHHMLEEGIFESGSTKIEKSKVSKKQPKKSKFQEYLDMEKKRGLEDLETEIKLAKKLKIKGGKLDGVDDGLNELFGGLSYSLDSALAEYRVPADEKEDGDAEEHVPSRKKRRKKRRSVASGDESDNKMGDLDNDETESAVETNELSIVSEEKQGVGQSNANAVKYVAPHLRASGRTETEELAQIRRRVRGLLNRLSESNVASVTQEIAGFFRTIARSDGCRIVGEEVLSSCANGPRGSEQHAAVFAAFVAGMACLVGMDFSAKIMASLAVAYENEYVKEDNLSLRNITLLLSYMCVFGVCSSDLIYDFLSVLSKRMKESDVSTILAILQCCGMKLRSDDPIAMKDFILNVQSRVNELKCPSGSSTDAQPKINNKRMEFMLETICDIKNNKKRDREDSAHHTQIKKWLQKLNAEDILLRGLKWSKLLDQEKKGQWWLSGEMTATDKTVENVGANIDMEVLEDQNLIQLAAAQRMNTDIRRAIFCVIMSGKDYLDAFEKILRLDLSGKQDREIMRVLVECCLQEKIFNKYYVILASRLCSHEKNHKFTLQYCLWDHFKSLDSMELHRSMNLAKFVAEMLSSFTLSLALLKAVDLTDPKQLTPKRIMHFRMLFETIFQNPDTVIWNMFTRVAALPEREILGRSIEFFVKKFVIANGSEKSFSPKFRIVKKALDNVAGVLM